MRSIREQTVEFWKKRGVTLSADSYRELVETTEGIFRLLTEWDKQGSATKKEKKHEATRKKK